VFLGLERDQLLGPWFVCQDGPAASFNLLGGGAELFFERVPFSEVGVNLVGYLSTGLSSAVWFHVGPERAVHGMARTVKGEVSLDSFDVDTCESCLSGFLELVYGGVCAVYVGEVVFVMVESHDFFAYCRDEGVVRIGKIR